jgi:hypothetical protein
MRPILQSLYRTLLGRAAWPVLLLLAAAAVLVPVVHRGRRALQPPSELTVPTLVEYGRSLGWEAHAGYREEDGEGVLFLDRKRNAGAKVVSGVAQPGALYVVQTASEADAERRLKERPTVTQEAWGRFALAGDLDMADELKERGSAP